MRFSLWSDYGMPARKYGMSARRPSLVWKIFLTTVLVAAAVIGIRELYGQAVEKGGLLEPAARPQSLAAPSANATGRRSAGVAAVPLSPQPALAADHVEVAAVTIVSPALRRPEPPSEVAPAVASPMSGDHAIPPALTAVPGALAKAAALPPPTAILAAVRPPAALAAMKSADGPKGVGARNVAHVAHRARYDSRNLVGYAEALATRFGHGKEFRAALQSFM